MKKKVIVFFTIITLLFILSKIVYAVDISEIYNQNWGSNVPSGTIKDVGGQVIAIMQVIGVSIAVIMLIVLAIKYISAAPNDKAEIKKHMVPYIVGAVLIFAASGVLGIIRGFVKSSLNVAYSAESSGTTTEYDSNGRIVKKIYSGGNWDEYNYDTMKIYSYTQGSNKPYIERNIEGNT